MHFIKFIRIWASEKKSLFLWLYFTAWAKYLIIPKLKIGIYFPFPVWDRNIDVNLNCFGEIMVNYIEPVPKGYKIINLNQHLGTWTKVRIEFKYTSTRTEQLYVLSHDRS